MIPGQPPQAPPQTQQGAPGGPVTIDAVVALLRDDRMRGFRIDVETDSMIEADQSAERQHRTEFVTAVGQFLVQLGPVVQVMPPMAPLVGEMLKFAVRGFKVGQELEEIIDKTMANVVASLNQPKPPPQPHPDELVKLEGTKAKVGAEIEKAHIGVQEAQVVAATKVGQAQMDQAGKASEAQHKQAEHELKMEQLDQQRVLNRETHQQQLEQIAADAEAAKQGAKE